MKVCLKVSGGFGGFQPQYYTCDADESLTSRINDAIVRDQFSNKGIPVMCDSRQVELTVYRNEERETFMIDESCALPEVLSLIDDIMCVTEG